MQIRQWKHWEDAIQKKEAEAAAADPEQGYIPSLLLCLQN